MNIFYQLIYWPESTKPKYYITIFGDLSEDYITEIYKELRYLDIINHKNFNPRLISFITDSHRLLSTPPHRYWQHIKDTLSNPKDIWRNVFDSQIDAISRDLTIAIVMHGQAISEENLKALFQRLKAVSQNNFSEKSYDVVVRLLVGALLNRIVIDENMVLYNLFNPSIADFVIANYLTDFNYVHLLLNCLRTPQAIYNLNNLLTSKVIDSKFYCQLMESQLLKLSKERDGEKIDHYKLSILASCSEILSPSDELLEYFRLLARNSLESKFLVDLGSDYLEFINWALEQGFITLDDPRLLHQLDYWISSYQKKSEEFVPLSKIIALTESPPSKLTIALKDQYMQFLSEEITEDIIDAGVLNDVFDNDSYDPSSITEYVESRISELAIEFERSEIEWISQCCDIDDVIESNIQSATNDDHHYQVHKEQRNSMESSDAAIHDLFDRS